MVLDKNENINYGGGFQSGGQGPLRGAEFLQVWPELVEF